MVTTVFTFVFPVLITNNTLQDLKAFQEKCIDTLRITVQICFEGKDIQFVNTGQISVLTQSYTNAVSEHTGCLQSTDRQLELISLCHRQNFFQVYRGFIQFHALIPFLTKKNFFFSICHDMEKFEKLSQASNIELGRNRRRWIQQCFNHYL